MHLLFRYVACHRDMGGCGWGAGTLVDVPPLFQEATIAPMCEDAYKSPTLLYYPPASLHNLPLPRTTPVFCLFYCTTGCLVEEDTEANGQTPQPARRHSPLHISTAPTATSPPTRSNFSSTSPASTATNPSNPSTAASRASTKPSPLAPGSGNPRGPYVTRTIMCEPLASLVHGREAPYMSISRSMVEFTLVGMSPAACAERETEIR